MIVFEGFGIAPAPASSGAGSGAGWFRSPGQVDFGVVPVGAGQAPGASSSFYGLGGLGSLGAYIPSKAREAKRRAQATMRTQPGTPAAASAAQLIESVDAGGSGDLVAAPGAGRSARWKRMALVGGGLAVVAAGAAFWLKR